ncbi:MAG TPA: hypothetical protein VH480_25755 [Streptosporangiaceae bacterium]|jgi:hypothetical protein
MGTAEVQGALWGAAARDWADLNEPVCAVLCAGSRQADGRYVQRNVFRYVIGRA